MNEAKIIVQQYFDRMAEAAGTLSELEARAAEVKAQQERMDAAHEEIAANESTVEQLRQERRELMRFYQEADFEGDISRKAKITKRRIAIDAEVKRLGKEADRLHTVAEQNRPDAREAATLAVALDKLTYPDPFDFAEELKRSLRPEQGEMGNRTHEAKMNLPSYSLDDYERARLGDEGYESQKRLDAHKLEKAAEKGRKLRASIAREEAIAAGPVAPGDRVTERQAKPWEDDDE